MQLSGRTQVVGIFGDPVEHSLSPKMQNAAIAANGLDAVYVPFHVTPPRLSDAVAGLRALGMRGVNLTVPHKEAACRLVDELDTEAVLIGAINTIVNDNGRLKGYNTDSLGFLVALETEFGFAVEQRRVLLLGAGGACRAALVALCRAGAAWVGVANRTRARAAALVTEMASRFPGTTLAELDLAELELARPGCRDEAMQVDLLVNTTVVGLKGDSFNGDVTRWVRPKGLVFDMVYGERSTPLVATARAQGLQAADGLAMLAGQGEAAFRLWFGEEHRARVMRQVLSGTSSVEKNGL